MQRGSSFLWVVSIVLLCGLPAFSAASNPGSVSELAEWDVTSYKVNLLDHRGGSGGGQSVRRPLASVYPCAIGRPAARRPAPRQQAGLHPGCATEHAGKTARLPVCTSLRIHLRPVLV